MRQSVTESGQFGQSLGGLIVDLQHQLEQALATSFAEVREKFVAQWQREKTDFPNYAAGSAGPESAAAMMARDNRVWCQ